MPKGYLNTPISVQDVYDFPEVVKRYSSEALWIVEQYIIDKYIPNENCTILDIACASGRFSYPLSKISSFNVVGFDISFNQIKMAEKNGNQMKYSIPFFQCDMRSMSLKSNFFDYAFITYSSLGAITDLQDRCSTIREVYRILKPGGNAFISIWNLFWYKSLHKWIYLYIIKLLGRYPYKFGNRVCWECDKYVLWHFFSPFEAKRLFINNGFRISDVIPFEGSWEKNKLVKSTIFAKFTSQGLFYFLTKIP